ncbi:LLM class flavin-dependent oxidoreductase [Sphingobium sp.]|uniref:LLM class flavin-dependent oxidoreductase n=1 Tax=Sphingobium sp. TaxID=1912891 RepID=UPI0039C937C0
MEPRPVPASPPPIWIGGGSDKAVERAARWGDGWMPYFTVPTNDPEVRASSVVSIEHFVEKRDRLLELRDKLGRKGPFEIAVNPPLRLQPSMPGEAACLIDLAGELAECGIGWVWTPFPASSRAEFLDHIQWFGEEVITKFGPCVTF